MNSIMMTKLTTLRLIMAATNDFDADNQVDDIEIDGDEVDDVEVDESED